MNVYWFVFFGAAILTQLATVAVMRAARSLQLVDLPNARKVHKTPVPRVGGVAIMLGAVSLSLAAMAFDRAVGLAVRPVVREVTALLAGGLVVFGVGLWDDIRPRPAVLKLAVLLGAAVTLALAGGRIETISISGGGSGLHLGWLSWPVTVLWIVGVAVAVNFIDGLDGLAAGIALVVCALIAVLALLSRQTVMAVLMLAMTGSLAGFLFFNFNPARIFMGDCGSMFLGFMIAGASVVCQAKTSALVGIAVPALALGLPVMDAMLTFVRRAVLDRRSIFAAERGHIHHRLLEKGLSHKSAVLVLYGITLAVAALALLMLFLRGAGQLVALGGGIGLLMVSFRLAGASRLKETLSAFLRNSAISHQAKKDRSSYEDVQLQLREARTFSAWWQAAEALAQKMEFHRMVMEARVADGVRRYVWSTGSDRSNGTTIDVRLPVAWAEGGLSCRIELRAHRNGSMESFGRRLSLFGRMLDESPPLALLVRSEAVGVLAGPKPATKAPEAA